MEIRTVGDLRKLIDGKPDDMEILPSIGPEVEDFLLDAGEATIKQGSESFYASLETRCDDIERLYVSIDGSILGMPDDEEEEGEEL